MNTFGLKFRNKTDPLFLVWLFVFSFKEKKGQLRENLLTADFSMEDS